MQSSVTCLSEKCVLLCTLANSALKVMLSRLFSGKLDMKELETLDAKRNQLEKLCTADGKCNLCDVQSTLETRKEECTGFKRQLSQLSAFCRQMIISGLQIEGKIPNVYYLYGMLWLLILLQFFFLYV